MDERGLKPFTSSRRNLVKGGFIAAAVAPWTAGSSATAASHVMYPRIGQRVLAEITVCSALVPVARALKSVSLQRKSKPVKQRTLPH